MAVCTGLAQVCIWSGNTPTLNTEAFSAWQLSQMKNWFPPGCSYGQAPYPVVPTQNELNGIFDSLSYSIVSGLVCWLVSLFVCLFTLPAIYCGFWFCTGFPCVQPYVSLHLYEFLVCIFFCFFFCSILFWLVFLFLFFFRCLFIF